MEPTREHYKQVRDDLRSGALPWYDPRQPDSQPKGDSFNMRWEYRDGVCGTVMCIGGAAYSLANPDPSPGAVIRWCMDHQRAKTPLGELFYPTTTVLEYDQITAEQAARAIDNWLENEQPRWDEVLSQ